MNFKLWLENNQSQVIIGDVHGKHDQYLDIIKNHDKSIQIGDFGLDYSKIPQSDTHKFFRGNHDNYDVNHPNDLGNFGMHDGWFYIRGADSVDKHARIEGKNWWRNEELSYGEMQQAIQEYSKIKPDKVLSHDCPQQVAEELFGIFDKSMTRQGLQAMFEIHAPAVWIFGHHHQSKDQYIWSDNRSGRTRFICLAELETFEA